MAVRAERHTEHSLSPRELAGSAELNIMTAMENLNEIPEFVTAATIANFWKLGDTSFTRGHQSYSISFSRVDAIDDPDNKGGFPKGADVRTLHVVRFTPKEDEKTLWEQVFIRTNGWEHETNQESATQRSFIHWSSALKSNYPEEQSPEERKEEEKGSISEKDNLAAVSGAHRFIDTIRYHVVVPRIEEFTSEEVRERVGMIRSKLANLLSDHTGEMVIEDEISGCRYTIRMDGSRGYRVIEVDIWGDRSKTNSVAKDFRRAIKYGGCSMGRSSDHYKNPRGSDLNLRWII